MKLSFYHLPIVILTVLTLALGAWTISPASAKIGEQVSQRWNSFLQNANAGASDHNKLKDCVTEEQ